MKPKSLNPKCANPKTPHPTSYKLKKNYFLFYINLKKNEKKDIGNTYDEIRKCSPHKSTSFVLKYLLIFFFLFLNLSYMICSVCLICCVIRQIQNL